MKKKQGKCAPFSEWGEWFWQYTQWALKCFVSSSSPKKSASPPHTKEILKVEDKYQQWLMIDTGTVWKNWTATCLCKVTGFHLQVLREVGNVFVRPFSIILEKKILGKSCMNGERKNVVPTFTEGQKSIWETAPSSVTVQCQGKSWSKLFQETLLDTQRRWRQFWQREITEYESKHCHSELDWNLSK